MGLFSYCFGLKKGCNIILNHHYKMRVIILSLRVEENDHNIKNTVSEFKNG